MPVVLWVSKNSKTEVGGWEEPEDWPSPSHPAPPNALLSGCKIPF